MKWSRAYGYRIMKGWIKQWRCTAKYNTRIQNVSEVKSIKRKSSSNPVTKEIILRKSVTPVGSKIYALGFANKYLYIGTRPSQKEDVYIVFSIFADKYKVYNVRMVRRYLTNSHIRKDGFNAENE